jgi:hypothetical protein
MESEGHAFASPAELTAAAGDSVREGLFHRVGRDDDEPALFWLDRLAARRSDWHGAIAAALASLAGEGGDAASAVVDWFDRAVTAPAFAATLRKILASHSALASTSPTTLNPQAEPLTLASIAPRVEQAAARYAQPTQHLLFREPRREITAFSTREDLTREASVAAELGDSRLQGGVDGWYTLDFLRQLAYFVPWARRALPAVLTDLAGQGVAGARAAVEYAVRAGDKAWILAILQAWSEDRPDWWDAEAAFPQAEGATLGANVEAAIRGAQAEAETSPGPR